MFRRCSVDFSTLAGIVNAVAITTLTLLGLILLIVLQNCYTCKCCTWIVLENESFESWETLEFGIFWPWKVLKDSVEMFMNHVISLTLSHRLLMQKVWMKSVCSLELLITDTELKSTRLLVVEHCMIFMHQPSFLLVVECVVCIMCSVLWHCWLDGRKGIWTARDLN